jgi:hypothetical protein
MKKFNLWLLLSLFVSASMFTACCSTDDVSGGGGDVPGPGPVPAPMSMAQLSGFVYDENGDPIDGVTVTSGTSSVKTNAHGAFTLSSVNVVNGRSVVRFSNQDLGMLMLFAQLKLRKETYGKWLCHLLAMIISIQVRENC